MIWRVALILVLLTATALALHENTFAVFELKEELQMRYMNMWELFQQLEYVTYILLDHSDSNLGLAGHIRMVVEIMIITYYVTAIPLGIWALR
jgi:hypothetical protein